ncbi:MAG: DUF3084 domain-containing protein [Spirulinaceae cyanobacterium]
MVTSAAVLLAAILLLGGIIAVLGDRLGTKVGKARLRIFGLRPRQTATVVTVITGTLISASTLGILFAFSKPLRQGVFEIDEILAQKRIAEGELGSVTAERDRVAQELSRVIEEKSEVEQGLIQSQSFLNNTNEQLGDLRDQLQILRSERQRVLRERQSLIEQRRELLQEIPKLQASVKERDRELARQDRELAQRDRTIERKESEIAQKNQAIGEREQRLAEIEDQRRQLQDELSERDTALAALDKSIAERDRILRSREDQLAQLEQEINSLQNQLQRLAENYQEFRQGNVALVRGQVLAFGVVRILEPEAARGAVEQLLREANRVAISATRPLSNDEVRDRIVQIPRNQVEQAIEQIDDGREYAIRILAAENYVEEETPVFVVVDVARNSVVFQEDEIIATIALKPSEITPQDLQNRLDVLLAAAQFRGRRAGVLGDIQIEDGRIVTLTQFVEQVLAEPNQYDQITAIAAQRTYVAGPLKLRLLAFKDGKMVLST